MGQRRFFTREMGARLRDLLSGAGLTQDELAERMGYSSIGKRMVLRRLEIGRIRKPTLEMVPGIFRAAGRGGTVSRTS